MMISKIQDVRAQGSALVPDAGKTFENRVKTRVSLTANKDVYISHGGIAEYPGEKVNRKNLSLEMASALASKYDVTNMTRNEYGNLLRELRDSGVISSKDFSVG